METGAGRHTAFPVWAVNQRRWWWWNVRRWVEAAGAAERVHFLTPLSALGDFPKKQFKILLGGKSSSDLF